MKQGVKILFRNMESSPAIEEKIKKLADKLNHFSDKIQSCSITIECSHHHQHKGNLYHATIDLNVPGAELVASRDPVKKHEHEDVYVAIRDAFDAITRQLKDHNAMHHGHHHHQSIKNSKIEDPDDE